MNGQLHIISCADELLLISDMSGSYRLEADIDLCERLWTPIGSRENPFVGSFDGGGHCVSNVEICGEGSGAYGFFGEIRGKAYSLAIDNINVTLRARGDSFAGAIAGINCGRIADVHVSGGALHITAEDGTLEAGSIVGKNCAMLQNSDSAVRLEATTCGGTIYGGGLAGEADGGLMETLECTGEMAFIGDNALLNIGLFAGRMHNTVLRACRFSSPLNTVNGELFQNIASVQDEAVLDGNIWRDNRNSDRFLDKESLRLRGIVENHMRRMATVEWTPNRTLTLRCSCAGKEHYQRFERGVTQYGLPYSHHAGSYERFAACFSESGELQPWLKSDGYDGFDLYMGNDCSSAVYWAWSRVSDTVCYEWTWTMLPSKKKGVIPVGDYDAFCSDCTEKIIEQNTQDRIAEAYACLHKGDAILHSENGGGHARLCSASAVVYRAPDGTIDFLQSYLTTHEQGDGLLYNPPKGKSRSWLTDHKYNFLRLLREHFIPLSIRELQECAMPEQTVQYTAEGEATAVNRGVVSSNYRIISVTAELLEQDGTPVWEKTIFTGVHAYDGHGNKAQSEPIIEPLRELVDAGKIPVDHLPRLKKEYNSRICVKSFDLREFAPYWCDGITRQGHEYIYRVKTLLSTGDEHEALNLVITA